MPRTSKFCRTVSPSDTLVKTKGGVTLSVVGSVPVVEFVVVDVTPPEVDVDALMVLLVGVVLVVGMVEAELVVCSK